MGDILMFLLWICFALLISLLELGHPGLFYFLSLALGALVASVVDFLGFSFLVQVVIFGVSSLILWLILAYFVTSMLDKKHPYRSNVYAMKGMRGVVIEPIEPFRPGAVKVAGQIWSALAANNQQIEEGTVVEVVDVRGVHLVVNIFSGE
jgi:membrane protein implicated in regulation of membrane protease activity